jgi:hypothetical protein
MKSANSYKLLDLERDIPTTREDVIAMRRVWPCRHLSFKDYLEFLATFPQVASDTLRARKHPSGAKPFEL